MWENFVYEIQINLAMRYCDSPLIHIRHFMINIQNTIPDVLQSNGNT